MLSLLLKVLLLQLKLAAAFFIRFHCFFSCFVSSLHCSIIYLPHVLTPVFLAIFSLLYRYCVPSLSYNFVGCFLSILPFCSYFQISHFSYIFLYSISKFSFLPHVLYSPFTVFHIFSILFHLLVHRLSS